MRPALPPRPIEIWLLIALWIAARVYPLLNTVPWREWEIWEAHKLLDYGFFARGGAAIQVPFMTGHLPFPQDLNYVNHPYGILWLDTLLFSVFGSAGVITMILSARLGSTLLAWHIFRHYVSPSAAWSAAALLALLPAGLALDVDSNCIAFAAVMWPVVTLLAHRGLSNSLPQKWRLWLLALAVFASVQTNWFSLTWIPSLLLMTRRDGDPWRGEIKRLWTDPACRAISSGAGAALALFATQVIIYTPNLGAVAHYIGTQAGFHTSEITRTRMTTTVLLRTLLFVGPALVVAGICGVRASQRNQSADRTLALAFGLYSIAFVAAGLVLTQFFFIERSPYIYLGFPAAYFAANSIESTTSRAYHWFLGVLALLTTGYISLTFSIPAVTNTSIVIGNFIAAHTSPSDLVLSNLRPQTSPFASWDTGSTGSTAMVADRLAFFDIETPAQISDKASYLGRNFSSAVFVRDMHRPLPSDMLTALRAAGKPLASATFVFPAEPVTIAHRLRESIWKFSGRFQSRAPLSSVPMEAELEIYRLK